MYRIKTRGASFLLAEIKLKTVLDSFWDLVWTKTIELEAIFIPNYWMIDSTIN
jgi:hypothetical protein